MIGKVHFSAHNVAFRHFCDLGYQDSPLTHLVVVKLGDVLLERSFAHRSDAVLNFRLIFLVAAKIPLIPACRLESVSSARADSLRAEVVVPILLTRDLHHLLLHFTI